jgi:hypothetical protein
VLTDVGGTAGGAAVGDAVGLRSALRAFVAYGRSGVVYETGMALAQAVPFTTGHLPLKTADCSTGHHQE